MRTLVLLLFAVKLSSEAAVAPRSLQTDDLTLRLSKRVSSYDIGALSLVGALLRVSNDFRVPMGIAWVNSPSVRAERPFAWKDATVQEIIQAIAKTQPGYSVQIRNGVVHVSPSMIPDGENFLKLKIKTYQTHNAMVEVASFKLHMLVTPIRGNHQVSIAGPGDSNVNVDLRDASVETVLDALVKASNRKIWIVTFTDDPSLSPRGLRRVGSLWSDKATPDEEQPSWDLLHWGDPMPPLLKNQTSHTSP
jgi:hypothetical protein